MALIFVMLSFVPVANAIVQGNITIDNISTQVAITKYVVNFITINSNLSNKMADVSNKIDKNNRVN